MSCYFKTLKEDLTVGRCRDNGTVEEGLLDAEVGDRLAGGSKGSGQHRERIIKLRDEGGDTRIRRGEGREERGAEPFTEAERSIYERLASSLTEMLYHIRMIALDRRT